MTRLGLLSAAVLGLATLTAPAAAQDAVGVTGAGEATFPDGASFNGISLKGLTLGQGMFIAPDGSATGQFQAVLLGSSLLGTPQNITVEGWVDARPLTVNRAVNVPVSRAPPPRRGPPPTATPGPAGSAGATGRQTTRCIPAAVENTSGPGCHSGDTRGSPLAPRPPLGPTPASAGHFRITLPAASRTSSVTAPGAAALR